MSRRHRRPHIRAREEPVILPARTWVPSGPLITTASAKQRDVVDHLVDRGRTRVRLKHKTHACCKDPDNLTEVVGQDEYQHGRLVQVCRVCYRRHFTLRADPTKLGATFQGPRLVAPSLQTRKQLKL